MSFETDFDTAFTILLGKAQNTITQTVPSTPPVTTTPTVVTSAYSVVFQFGGGGAALTTAADPVLVEVPDAGDLVWVHLYAGNAAGVGVSATATLELTRGAYGSVPTGTMNGGGAAPSMTAASFADMSLAGWTTHVAAGDALRARIVTVSGTATWLSLIVRIRRDGT